MAQRSFASRCPFLRRTFLCGTIQGGRTSVVNPCRCPHSSEQEESTWDDLSRVLLSGCTTGQERFDVMAGNWTIREGIAFFCSWSGGKDSALALYRAMSAGARPCFLLTMLDEGGERSRSHGIPLDVLRGQAASLGIPLRTGRASWSEYESVFHGMFRDLPGRYSSPES